ncbi:hypothetical protein SAMN05421780_101558 [Flexibacter flexilis DSM 6793]|uniref:Uncharacterized protein n=1 Tax=Flexibacter flexilis DSM 6793 TaxID=927664 RepID=A0A1I1E034_9BACT|nr:hypothetical protein [Flexibacter flexilis]SFB80555.1 hypothetical protein SAMN05421780_101558 [Flexibacter flexilis DSM 6793]
MFKHIVNLYKALGAYILSECKDEDGNLIIKYFDEYQGQDDWEEDESPVDYPAVFFEPLITPNDIGRLHQIMNIDFSLYVANTTLEDTNIGASNVDEALKVYDYAQAVLAYVNGWKSDEVGSITLKEIKKKTSRSNVNVLILTFTTKLVVADSETIHKPRTTITLDGNVTISKTGGSPPAPSTPPLGSLYDLS